MKGNLKHMKNFEKFESFIRDQHFYKKFWDITPDKELNGFCKLPKKASSICAIRTIYAL